MRYAQGQIIDHYEILEALGEGAYAEVYKARDTRSDTLVVLKSPDPLTFADPQVYERFQRETKIARALDFPGVQRCLDLQEEHGDPYLILEYVEGETMRRRERDDFPDGAPLDVVRDWGRQLAAALAYLHDRGITHRDLKPENVLVSVDGVLKVADFGTALMAGARRLTWRHLTENVGTPDYMSPEQIQGERGDPRSDIYALGIMLYELLVGHVPFEGDNWLAVMAGHLRRTPKSIHSQRPDVPRALEAVVLKAMRRYPDHRYQSADALLADLDHLDELDILAFDLSPEPPMGGSAGSPGQLWLRLAGIAIGFLVLLVLIVVFAKGVR